MVEGGTPLWNERCFPQTRATYLTNSAANYDQRRSGTPSRRVYVSSGFHQVLKAPSKCLRKAPLIPQRLVIGSLQVCKSMVHPVSVATRLWEGIPE